MNLLTKTIFTLVSSLIFSSFLIAKDNFSPFMLDHEYEGCPTNSICTKEFGVIRTNWKKIISQKSSANNRVLHANNFKKKSGIPLGIWTTEKELKNSHTATWDSPCRQHSKSAENMQIYQASSIIKNFNDLGVIPGTLSDRGMVKYSNSTDYQLFFVPRREVPAYLDNSGLIFLMEDDGDYYAIKIKSSGDFDIVEFDKKHPAPEETLCAEELKKNFLAKNSPPANLYSEYFCKNIWNINTKAYVPIILGWSCL